MKPIPSFSAGRGVPGVLLRTNTETRHVCTKIAEEGFPHVVISERFDDPHVNWIDCESTPDSVRAVEYLISLGHERIAFAMSSAPDRDHLDRFEGYRQALVAHGLPLHESLIFRNQFTMAGGATVMDHGGGYARAAHRDLFCGPDDGASGAVQRAHALGVRIPEDFSVVGFDDTDVRHAVYPTLTAVCQDAAQLGFQAAPVADQPGHRGAEGSVSEDDSDILRDQPLCRADVGGAAGRNDRRGHGLAT